MSLPQLQDTLCGCSLRTGSKVIAWLSLAIGTLELLVIAGLLVTFSPEDIKNLDTPDIPDDKKAAIAEYGAEVLAIECLLILISLILTIFLIVGILKDRHTYMYPWILLHILLTVCSYLAGLASLLTHGPNHNAARDIVVAIVSTYLVMIVNSHYTSVKNSTSKAVLVNC